MPFDTVWGKITASLLRTVCPVFTACRPEKQTAVLDHLYGTGDEGRLRQRAQIILLAAEQGMVAARIGEIVWLNEESVRKWLKRYEAEGIEGLKAAATHA